MGSLAEARDVSARQSPTATAGGLDTLAKKPIDADPDAGITTDKLMGASGVNPEEVHAGTARHCRQRHGGDPLCPPRRAASIDEPPRESERARVCAHRPVCGRPPPTWSRTTRRRSTGGWERRVSRDAGHTSAVPEQIWRVLQGIGQGRTRRTGRPERQPESAQARPRGGAADAAPPLGGAGRHRRPTPHRRPGAPPAVSLRGAGRSPRDRSAGRDDRSANCSSRSART